MKADKLNERPSISVHPFLVLFFPWQKCVMNRRLVWLINEDAMIWASYQMRKIAGRACTGNAGNDFPATDLKGNHQLAIPACITARASRTCPDACRDRLTRGGGENVPGIPGACATRKVTYLARGPWRRFPCYRPFVRAIRLSLVDSARKGTVLRSFDALFDVNLLMKQSNRRWFETPWSLTLV